jgi:hypothetical protein
MNSRKTVTEAELLTALTEGKLQFLPLQTMEVQRELAITAEGRKIYLDALLTLRWHGQSYRFGVEAKALWTPKVVSVAIEIARRNARLIGVYPMILVPYLSEDWLLTLEAQAVSGIDLCGNGVVIVPDQVLILRTGFPNRFRWEGTIKNVYRRGSSVVARVFLLIPKFGSVKEALAAIRRRGGEVTVATVSKVCKSLEDDLVIERGRGDHPVARRLRLLQPEKLLDLLADNYTPPAVSRTLRGKCNLEPEEVRKRLAQAEEEGGARVALTGGSSVEAYAVMAREPLQSFYCSDIARVIASLGGDIRETDRFANVAFLKTRDDFVYFDRRPGLVASPIQCYLELVKGDERERETADQVRRVILAQLGRASQEER